jgi:hypothetical protein
MVTNSRYALALSRCDIARYPAQQSAWLRFGYSSLRPALRLQRGGRLFEPGTAHLRARGPDQVRSRTRTGSPPRGDSVGI